MSIIAPFFLVSFRYNSNNPDRQRKRCITENKKHSEDFAILDIKGLIFVIFILIIGKIHDALTI